MLHDRMSGWPSTRRQGPPPEAEVTLAKVGIHCNPRREELSQLDLKPNCSFWKTNPHSIKKRLISNIFPYSEIFL